MTTQRINASDGQVTGNYPEVTPDGKAYTSIDLFDTLGVPSPELARRIVRMLNLPAVVEKRLAAERSNAA